MKNCSAASEPQTFYLVLPTGGRLEMRKVCIDVGDHSYA